MKQRREVIYFDVAIKTGHLGIKVFLAFELSVAEVPLFRKYPIAIAGCFVSNEPVITSSTVREPEGFVVGDLEAVVVPICGNSST